MYCSESCILDLQALDNFQDIVSTMALAKAIVVKLAIEQQLHLLGDPGGWDGVLINTAKIGADMLQVCGLRKPFP